MSDDDAPHLDGNGPVNGGMNGAPPEEPFLDVLEKSLRGIIKNRKTSKADKLAAVAAGVKLEAIRHKLNEQKETGFFG